MYMYFWIPFENHCCPLQATSWECCVYIHVLQGKTWSCLGYRRLHVTPKYNNKYMCCTLYFVSCQFIQLLFEAISFLKLILTMSSYVNIDGKSHTCVHIHVHVWGLCCTGLPWIRTCTWANPPPPKINGPYIHVLIQTHTHTHTHNNTNYELTARVQMLWLYTFMYL